MIFVSSNQKMSTRAKASLNYRKLERGLRESGEPGRDKKRTTVSRKFNICRDLRVLFSLSISTLSIFSLYKSILISGDFLDLFIHGMGKQES